MAVLLREELQLPVSHAAIEAVLNFHSKVARKHEIFFLEDYLAALAQVPDVEPEAYDKWEAQ